MYAKGHGQRSKIKVTGVKKKHLAVSGLFEFTYQTRTQTNFIQHKWIQLPHQVYMHWVKTQITLYSWYIIMKYRHVRRPPYSVENPSTVDPQWNILYWGSKWNLHTVCWGAVGCEWGTTTEATATRFILPPRDLFYCRQFYFHHWVLCYCREIYFNAVSFILLPQVLF